MNERPPRPDRGKPAGGRARPAREARARHARDEDVAVLYGWHPVVEALRNERRQVRRLLVTENSARRLHETFPALAVEPQLVRPGEISRLLEPDAVHQGLYLEADPLPSPTLDS